MTRSEAERVKHNLDIAGGPLLAMINDRGTMNEKIGLLIAFYMFEVRKADWTTLCIHANVWDEIKREMQYHRMVYYREGLFSANELAHAVNSLYSLFKAAEVDRRTFDSQFLLFKLALA
jgi:hypothetical protein